MSVHKLTSIRQVLDQHVEEAALNWLRRDEAVTQPHYTIEDLATLDDRMQAHLDGLRIAEADSEDAAWQVCEQELRWGEPGEIFPAAILAIESRSADRIRRVIEAAGDSRENLRALVSALAWLPYDQVSNQIGRFMESDEAKLRRVGIAASVAHGCDPESRLSEAIGHPDAQLNARALRAAGELGRADLLDSARMQLASSDQRCRFSAAWSVARMAADEQAIEVLRETVQQGGTDSDSALQMVLRVMDSDLAEVWIHQLIHEPVTARLGVQAIGVAALPLIPVLFEKMTTPELARVAGEAFSTISGVDLAYQDLEGEWPEGFSAGPTENPDDEEVAMDPDENLPWPNIGKLHAWWQQNQSEFDSRQRYLCGKPLTEPWLQHVLRHGFQRQRAAAALELGIMNPTEKLFNVRAPGQFQQRQLGLI